MKQSNVTKKRPIHRAVSIATAAIMAASLMPLNEMSDGAAFLRDGAAFLSSQVIAFAEGEEAVSVTEVISTAARFVEYSNIWNPDNEDYKTDGVFDSAKYEAAVTSHANDVIELAFSTGSTQGAFTNEDNGTFYSIGDENHPFTGIILINTDALGTLNLEKPLFNYLGDSAQILRKNGDGPYYLSTLNPYEITISRTEDQTGLPILANYVKPTLGENETAREWKVKIDSYSGNSNSYGGIIGTVLTGSTPCVSVIYNDGGADVWKGSGNVGRIVCDMEEASTLTIKSLTNASSEGVGVNVSTDNGHAGGIVGSMGQNSKIILSDAHTNTASMITAGGTDGYAGGLAGYCEGGSIELDTNSYSIAHTLTGGAGAGGVFGYYQTAGGELDLSDYSVNCTLSSGGNVGGIFGVLNNAAAEGETDAVSFTLKGSDDSSSQNLLYSSHTDTKATNYGGLIGMYQAGKLTDSLVIQNISTSPTNSGNSDYYGGAIGCIDGVAYVELEDFWATNCANPSNGTFGGVVGSADEAFVKSENITISTSGSASYTGGGVVGQMNNGVLQLVGTTDLSGTTATAGDTNGQILGVRDSALVFASLDEDDNEWSLIRGAAAPVDDIGTWGEVVRFSSDFSQDDVLTIADHMVTLADASGSISSEETFAAFALNNQIRTSSGVLTVGSGAASLYQTNITMGTVDLTDTGLIGLTRDGSDKYLDYQGTITGGNVTLAIGQEYGKRIVNDAETSASTAEEGSGQIYRHRYLGLIGKTSGATTISGTTLQGIINADTKADESYYIGLGVGKAESNITVDGVTVSSATINVNGNAKSCVGGLIGQFDGSTDNTRKLYIGQTTACSFGATIDGGGAATGGVIGRIGKGYVTQIVEGKETITETVGAFDAKIGKTTVTGSVTGTGAVGGLIASIVSSTQKQNRDLILTDVSTGALTVENGSLLGDTWYDTEVQLGTSSSNGVTIGTSSNASTVKGSGDMAGLINHATGQWIVNDVNITNLAVDSESVSSFGVLVNKGYKTNDTESALFMWLKNGYNYTITSISGSALDGASVFDEIVAYSASGDVTANGQGIVSIATSSGTVSMTKNAADNNTYVGRTSWGKKANSHTRYYYNLDSILRSSYGVTDNGDSLTAPKKLLAWSIQQYAHSSLNGYFKAPYANGAVGSSSDVFDMTGVSYYPVNIDAGKTVMLNGTVKLYNEEVEKTVINTSVTPEDKKRSTLNQTQHFLMQNGIFHNVSGNLKTGTVTLQGNVGHLETGGSGSGALICGELKGSSPDATAKFNKDVTDSVINLAGIEVWNIDANSPLLINTIPIYADATIIGVKTVQVNNVDAYPNGKQAASSLVGVVGKDDATDISIVFRDITLDARLTDSKLKSATAAEALSNATEPNESATDEEKTAYQKLVDENAAAAVFDNVYHTKNSIFTEASFLKSLSYNPNYKSSITAEYNYAFAKDWEETAANSGVYNHVAKVTYGAEISLGTGSQYNGLEYEYSDENFNSPLEAKPASQYEEFDDVFQRYVSVAYNTDTRKFQLKINHHSTNFTGCGTYNDPYIITSGTQFDTIVGVFSGTNPTDIYIGIPNGGVSSTWCNVTKDPDEPEHTLHKWYKYGTSSYDAYTWSAATNDYVRDTSTSSLTEYQMRDYLAKAYYKIDSAITLGDSYDGIGEYEYASGKFSVFHGVIDGGGAHITMNTDKPFIVASSGCVLKDLTIDVAHDVGLTQGSATQFAIKASESCANYGAAIGKVMGGDNILDNVHVSFAEGKKIQIDGSKAQLAPVGGYIGVVVNGGVYFRNMTRTNASGTAITYGLTNSNVQGRVGTSGSYSSDLLNTNNNKWLYVNPIIGRVINGFAVTESDAYRPFETGSRSRIYVKENAEADDPANTSNYSAIVTNEAHIKYNERVTMQNGTKNYSITDISPDLEDLSFTIATGETGNYNIKPKNAQSFFLMSCMVNSGMSYNNASSIGYYAANIMSRNLADYDEIGTNAASSTSCDDYNSYAKNDGTGTGKPGYLIKQYSDSENAKSMANQSAATITLTKQDYILPDGYRGVGNFIQDSDNYRLKVKTFTGNGSTILMNIKYMYHYIDAEDNYAPANKAYGGLGLFNYQSQTGSYSDFILSGSVKADIITKNGNSLEYSNGTTATGTDNNKSRLSVGMLFGATTVNQTIDSVALRDVDVFGYRDTGGLIGNIPGGDYSRQITITNSQSYDSVNVKVHGAGDVGGLIGRCNAGGLSFDYNNNTFSIVEVVSEATGRGNIYDCGAGGLIGVWRGNIRDGTGKDAKQAYDAGKGKATISNITVTNYTTNRPALIKGNKGGAPYNTACIIGTLNRAPLEVNNCVISNISCETQYTTNNNAYLGGVVGYCPTNAFITITNTQISSNPDTTSPLHATLENTGENTGGFVGGNGAGDNEAGCVIRNSSIQGYTISGSKKVGGLIGARNFDSNKNDNFWYTKDTVIENCKISDCIIKGDENVGGLLGYLSFYEFRGYNILANNLTFARYSGSGNIIQQGYIVGYVASKSETNNKFGDKSVKLVGFTRQNVSATGSEHLVGNDTFGADGSGNAGYVIFADYNGKSLDPTNNTKSSYTKTTVTYDANDTATSTNTATNVLYNTFTEDFLYSVTNDNVTTSSQNVSNQKTITYRIPKINSTTGKVERNNKGEIIYEVKSYSYGDNWPNVTSSPSYYLNSSYSQILAAVAASGDTPAQPAIDAQHFLTGDGVSSLYYSASAINNIPDSVAKTIITDIGNNQNKAYLNTGLDADALSNLNTALSTDLKYSTFKKEMGSRANSIPRDFPVLVVDDVSATNTNTFINNYLKLLTNSSLNYSTDKDGVFKVRTAKCTYSDSTHTFIPNYSTCNLKYNSGKGFSIGNSYDNEEKDGDTKLLVFSLIDVEFYDPSDPDSVAYHLYVPCVVKKLLQFTFEATTLSGSSYKISPEYTNNRNNTLLENFENPVTLEFRYTYKRELKDWRDAILSGENVLFSFSKDVLLVSATEDPVTHIKDTPGPMKMILVDPNKYSDETKQNIAYYADNTAEGQTCIVPADDGTNYHLQLTGFETESGETYSPKLVNDFLIVTATQVSKTGNFTLADGTTIKKAGENNTEIDTGIPEDATVRAICNGTTVYLKPSENNDGNYQISENADDRSVIYADGRSSETAQLYEDYYVTFLTERPDKSNDLYKYNAVAATDGAYVISSEGAEGAFKARLGENDIWLKAKGENETGAYDIEKLFHYSFESMRQLTAKAPDETTTRSYPTQSYQSKESHLYVGDLYNNSVMVKTYHTSELPLWEDPYHDSDAEISMVLPQLYVDLTAKVSLTKTAKGALGTTVQDNSRINVYQSLLYTFNWKKLENDSLTPTSKLGILSASDLDMISYTVTGTKITNGNVTDKYSKSNSETRTQYLDTSNKNYVELKNLIDIAESLSNEVTIDAKFKLTYDEKRDVTTQFAERTNDGDDKSGTSVIGYSNISSSRTETANSAMSTSKEGGSKYYSSEDNKASLQYDAVGKYADDFGEFGINANDLSETEEANGMAKVETIAYYSLDSWSSIKEPKKIRLEFEMFDKYGNLINGIRTPYSKNLTISDYLKDFKVYTSKDADLDGTESACTVVQSGEKYTYTIDLTEAGYQLLDYNDGLDSYTFYVDYNVITGKKTGSNAWFENLTRMYQNYMVKLTVSLIDIDDDGQEYVMTGSNPSDHIIYTNARINPDIIDTANP